MATIAAVAERASSVQLPAIASTPQRVTLTRMAAFAGLTSLAVWRYAGVQTRPPTARVVGLAAVAVLAAVALTVIRPPDRRSPRTRARAAAACLIVILVALVSALVIAGVPIGLVAPTGWGRLAHRLHRGLGTVANTLWPYSGTNTWTRLDILLAPAVIPLAAAAIAFWPAERGNPAAAARHAIRRVLALALLLTLYVLGVLDSLGGSATVEGLLLMVLVVGWLWLPRLRAPAASAVLAWLASAGVLSAALASQLGTSQSWLNYRAWNLLGARAGSTAFSWDQTYGPITWSRSQRTMFTVRASTPMLWRVTTLDRFDGLRFVRSGTEPVTDEDLPLPLNDRWYAFATFTISGLRSGLIPTEQGATAALTFGRFVRYEPDGTVQTIGRGLRSGDSYTVMSYAPRPDAAELRAAPRVFPAMYLRYTDFDLPAPGQSGLRVQATDPVRPGRFLTARTVGAPAPGRSPAAVARLARRIVASPYGPMYRLARRLAARTRSTYDVVIAVETYLKSHYAYSEQSPARRYPLESFLVDDRIGYCQQFSGAMALLLRMDGIPARVATGFLPGVHDSATGSYNIRALDAHAWVEVYFTGIGWVPFNPTPPRSVGSPQRPLVTSVSSSAISPDAIAATVGGPLPVAGIRKPVADLGRAGTARSGTVLSLLAAAAAVLLALSLLVARWLMGRARLRRSLAGDGELAAAELVSALRRLGFELPVTVTLTQIERVVRVHGGPEAAQYVRLLRERRYSAVIAGPVALRARRRLRHGLTAHLGLDARARGHWALPPGTLAWRPVSPR